MSRCLEPGALLAIYTLCLPPFLELSTPRARGPYFMRLGLGAVLSIAQGFPGNPVEVFMVQNKKLSLTGRPCLHEWHEWLSQRCHVSCCIFLDGYGFELGLCPNTLSASPQTGAPSVSLTQAAALDAPTTGWRGDTLVEWTAVCFFQIRDGVWNSKYLIRANSSC